MNSIFQFQSINEQKKHSAEKLELLEKSKLQAELQLLNSQLDPHFLYNALTSFSYINLQNPAEADRHNAKLASLYRYVLKNKCSAFVTLSQELQFCREYFSLQQLRFGDAIILQVLAGNENLEQLSIPPLALQSLIENALKHNCFSEKEPLLVQVHISKKEIQVTNKIKCAPYEKKSAGIGLTNLNQRLMLLCKKTIRVDKSNESFAVTIPIPSWKWEWTWYTIL